MDPERMKEMFRRNREHAVAADRYMKGMEYRRAGRSGLLLSRFSLGMWHNFGSTDCYENMRDMVFGAFDSGITAFDLANNYGPVAGAAERNFGSILANDLKSYRDEICISTKAGFPAWRGPYGDGGGKKYLIASLDRSLKNLGLDYVDVYYHHRPDPKTPLEETCAAFKQITDSGKALYIGISNYGARAREAAEMLKEMKVPIVLNQLQYSVLDRTPETDGSFETAKDCGVGIAVYSPLAQGLLTDKYLKGVPEDSRMSRDASLKRSVLTEQERAKIADLDKIAKGRGQSLAQMALSWVLRKEEVATVILGASRREQILDNLTHIDTEFTDAELAAIDRASSDKKENQ